MVRLIIMIPRDHIVSAITTALARNRVVVIVGPRQSGKTTLARLMLSDDSVNYFDLENPAMLARLDEPMTALAPLRGLVVIDEVQRKPDLFPILRVLADREGSPAKFLILGSASGDLMRQTSESLAGRVHWIRIGGFTLDEVGLDRERALWLRGGFPVSFLADTDQASHTWRSEFVTTLLERDFPQWGVRVPSATLLRFWTMLAHYHGQTWNGAEIGRSMGLSGAVVRGYLDLMTDALMVRQLQPWHANLGKRQVKSPKVYIRDSGILHQLLGISTEQALVSHPKLGASWEGFVIEHVLMNEPPYSSYFWATHQGAEIDLVLQRPDGLYGVEVKRADVPRLNQSIRIAMEDLGLKRVAVLYPGRQRYPIADRVEAVPFRDLASGLFNDETSA